MDSHTEPRNTISRRKFIELSAGVASAAAAAGWLHAADPALAVPNPDGGNPKKTFETFLRRREDQLRLKVEFWNLTLDTTGPQAMLKKDKNHASYLVFQLGPQALADRAYFKSGSSAEAVDQTFPPPAPPPPNNPPSEPPEAPPIDAVLASSSRLAFHVPSTMLPMPFTTAALLAWTHFDPRVVPNAVDRTVTEEGKGMGLREPKDDETAIEYPWHLVLSPHSQSTWAHSDTLVTHNGRTELWHTRLATKDFRAGVPVADEDNEQDRTVRAVWCLDPLFKQHLNDKNPPDSLWQDLPFRMSLTARDRLDIVHLSADYKLAKDTGVRPPVPLRTRKGREFIPEPIEVEELILSSLGGWLDSSFDNDLDFKTNEYNSSLLQWRHIGAMGRDAFVRVVRKGYLAPCGFKSAIIKITERRFDHVDDDVDPFDSSTHPTGAYLRQTIQVVTTRAPWVYENDPNMQNGGRRFPFRRMVCVTRITPNLDNPNQFTSHPEEQVFVPHFGGDPFLFQVRATDWAGDEHVFGMPLVWVDDTEAYEPDQPDPDLNEIIATYMSDGPTVGAFKPVDLANRRITMAPPTKPGDTTFGTASLSFGMELPAAGFTSNGMAAQGKPSFYPTVHRMSLNLPELAAAAGNAVDPPTLMYFEPYVTGGFGDVPNPNNIGDVFLAVPPEATPSKLGVGARSGGGVITPSLDIQGFSRKLGPTGDPADTQADDFTPEKFLDPNAKMLGGVLLVEVIAAITSIVGESEKALKITSKREEDPNRVETKIDWKPQLQAAPPGFFLLVAEDAGAPAATCDIKAEIVTNLDDPPASTYRIDGKIANVTLCLFGAENDTGKPGATTFVKVPVKELTFRAGSNCKEDLDCKLGDISFHGVLDFVAKMAETMSFGGGSGLKIDVDGGGIEILLTVALPDITLGVMSLTNMKIEVGLGIPFDGSPVDFRFAFCSREAPFTLTVWVFGGGGFVGLVITVEGVVLLEFSFEFGGGWAIDVVVASGKVEAKAGIYFKLETVEQNGKQVQKVHLEAYFRLHGSVDVMGLITASITLYLALIYESPPATLVGEASIVIEVEVLVFSGSVEVKVRKNLHKEEENANLAKAAGPQAFMAQAATEAAALEAPKLSFGDLLTAPQYAEYCNAYAPLGS